MSYNIPMPYPETLQSVLEYLNKVQVEQAQHYHSLDKQVRAHNKVLWEENARLKEQQHQQWENQSWIYRMFHRPPVHPYPDDLQTMPDTRIDWALRSLEDHLKVAQTLGMSSIEVSWEEAKRLATILDMLDRTKKSQDQHLDEGSSGDGAE